MSSQSVPTSDTTRDQVRVLQVRFLDRNFLATIPSCLIGLMATSYLFWADCRPALLMWIGGTVPLALLRFYLATQRAFTPLSELDPAVTWRCPPLDVALWISCGVPPLAIAFYYGDPVSEYMVVVASSVMWAGAFAYIAVFRLSMAFIFTNIVCWLLVSTYAGWGVIDYRPVVILVLMGLAALIIARQLSHWLEKSLRQKLRLKRQTDELSSRADTIALLLNEHESESSDWLWKIDSAGCLLDVSRRFAAAFNLTMSQAEGRSIVDLLAAPEVEGNVAACESLADHIANARPFREFVVPSQVGDERRWWSIAGRSGDERGARNVAFRGVMSDVTAEQRAKEEVYNLAHHDALTRLPNRVTFFKRLEAILGRKKPPKITVITLDLDGFKLANDKYGHPVGDQILIQVANRLSAVVADMGLVARLGGDEFVIKTLLSDRPALEALCDDLIRELSNPYEVHERLIRIGVSIGVAISPGDGEAADELTKNSDAALYRAKQSGRGQYRFFDHSADVSTTLRSETLQDLRDALVRGEFVLHYQPFICSTSGQITGYEALIRWHHPERGMVSPAEFIPLAEESGLIIPIGEWVLNRACADASGWQDNRRVAVNISAVQFQDHSLPDRIRNALEQSGLTPELLEIELTESVLVDDADKALAMLARIRALGIKIALDDFGTGYSSLSYLRTLSFDRVKIDRSFVDGVITEPGSSVIIRAVGDIAKGLGMSVIAEGVETLEQAQLLREKGCEEQQGFFYGRPVINEERLLFLDSGPASSLDRRLRLVASGRDKPMLAEG